MMTTCKQVVEVETVAVFSGSGGKYDGEKMLGKTPLSPLRSARGVRRISYPAEGRNLPGQLGTSAVAIVEIQGIFPFFSHVRKAMGKRGKQRLSPLSPLAAPNTAPSLGALNGLTHSWKPGLSAPPPYCMRVPSTFWPRRGAITTLPSPSLMPTQRTAAKAS
jgi:hypothetical protein